MHMIATPIGVFRGTPDEGGLATVEVEDGSSVELRITGREMYDVVIGTGVGRRLRFECDPPDRVGDSTCAGTIRHVALA